MRAAVGGDVGLVRLAGQGCGPSVKTLNRPCPWGGGDPSSGGSSSSMAGWEGCLFSPCLGLGSKPGGRRQCVVWDRLRGGVSFQTGYQECRGWPEGSGLGMAASRAAGKNRWRCTPMSLPMMVSSSSGIPSEVVVMMVCVCVCWVDSSSACCRRRYCAVGPNCVCDSVISVLADKRLRVWRRRPVAIQMSNQHKLQSMATTERCSARGGRRKPSPD